MQYKALAWNTRQLQVGFGINYKAVAGMLWHGIQGSSR